jgi:hypothetical protein
MPTYNIVLFGGDYCGPEVRRPSPKSYATELLLTMIGCSRSLQRLSRYALSSTPPTFNGDVFDYSTVIANTMPHWTDPEGGGKML